MVGVTGFEPTASWSRTKRATKLRYTPNSNFQHIYRQFQFTVYIISYIYEKYKSKIINVASNI